MGKRLFLLLILCLIAITSTPTFLTATDDVIISSINDARAVETIPLPEPEPEPEPAVSYAKAPVAGSRATNYTPAAPAIQNYTVTTYISSAKEFNNTAFSLSYSNIYKYKKLVYGHNSYNLLGSLSSRYAGETITVTEGGVVKQYRVAIVVTYAKDANGYLNGDPKLMTSIANTALGHDIALFTCTGTSYGNGDASHRLVVFADAM